MGFSSSHTKVFSIIAMIILTCLFVGYELYEGVFGMGIVACVYAFVFKYGVD